MDWELSQASVRYDQRTALHNVSCTIKEGKWISIIGPTGAGKSTFVKLLKGLIPQFDGEFRIDQQPVPRNHKGQPKVLPDIGFVFQYPEHQLFQTTVQKELAFAPKLKGYSSGQITGAIAAVLPQVGLSADILPKVPLLLSGGQKRRVAIASVLMMNPKLLILDEPTAGLDPLGRIALLQLLRQWQQQESRTVLLVSHNMDEVAEYSDEVMLFHEGRHLGHFEANTLFLEQPEMVESAGLSLPESVQLLQLVEQLSGQKIVPASCREQDIFESVRPVWLSRSSK